MIIKRLPIINILMSEVLSQIKGIKNAMLYFENIERFSKDIYLTEFENEKKNKKRQNKDQKECNNVANEETSI